MFAENLRQLLLSPPLGKVHPEAYKVVEHIESDLRVDIKILFGNESLLKNIQPKKYVTEEIGELNVKIF